MIQVWKPQPAGSDRNRPDRIIVHAMSEWIYKHGEYHLAWEYLSSIGLSVHAYITPTGMVVRGREDIQGAYHAKGFNTNTLGVEVLTQGYSTYSEFKQKIRNDYVLPIQYVALRDLVSKWCSTWGITDIVKHSDLSPDRKVDPGTGFKWYTFLNSIGR